MEPNDSIKVVNVTVAVRVRPLSTIHIGSESSNLHVHSTPRERLSKSPKKRPSSASAIRSARSKEPKPTSVTQVTDGKTICLKNPRTSNTGRLEQRTFRFDKVFKESSTQQELFSQVKFFQNNM